LLKSALVGACLSTAFGTLMACSPTEPDTVVYLVRHAEKMVGENVGKDPKLTKNGEARALVLAEMLGDKPITHIHSSDYIRTRDTAMPLATAKSLELEIYNPSDLPALAAKIKRLGGHHLVVGHSNTIPETVVTLGGDGGTPIFEDTEYDRLYEVTLLGDGTVHTDLRRYGTRSILPK